MAKHGLTIGLHSTLEVYATTRNALRRKASKAQYSKKAAQTPIPKPLPRHCSFCGRKMAFPRKKFVDRQEALVWARTRRCKTHRNTQAFPLGSSKHCCGCAKVLTFPSSNQDRRSWATKPYCVDCQGKYKTF